MIFQTIARCLFYYSAQSAACADAGTLFRL